VSQPLLHDSIAAASPAVFRFPLSALDSDAGRIVTRPRGAPLPERLPGEFFVLTYDRDSQVYTLFVDDAQESSYKLGNLETARLRFKVWGLRDFGDRCLDQAREFKEVQGIWSQGRVINLFDRKDRRNVFVQDDEDDRTYAPLPNL